MKIENITWQHRFDFDAILKCEHCEHEQELKNGYNDAYYHSKVLPSIRCKKCGRNRDGEADKPNGEFESV